MKLYIIFKLLQQKLQKLQNCRISINIQGVSNGSSTLACKVKQLQTTIYNNKFSFNSITTSSARYCKIASKTLNLTQKLQMLQS
jgi:hypothetical protein